LRAAAARSMSNLGRSASVVALASAIRAWRTNGWMDGYLNEWMIEEKNEWMDA